MKAREMLIDAINENKDYKSVPEIRKIFLQINEYNIEQFVSKLLYLITRNTGFEVTKGSLGICWRTDCCSFFNRQPDDLCGLDKSRLPLHDKMLQIVKNTGLQRELSILEG